MFHLCLPFFIFLSRWSLRCSFLPSSPPSSSLPQYLPPGPFFFTPSQVASRYPPLSYQVYLTNDRHLAASELDARPKDLVVGLLAEVGMENPPPTNPLSNTKTILGAWGDQPVSKKSLTVSEREKERRRRRKERLGTHPGAKHSHLPSLQKQIADQKLVSKPEEDYWVDAFKTSGFESTIAIYQVKNRKRSVDVASRRKTQFVSCLLAFMFPLGLTSRIPFFPFISAINVPTLYISPTEDALGKSVHQNLSPSTPSLSRSLTPMPPLSLAQPAFPLWRHDRENSQP